MFSILFNMFRPWLTCSGFCSTCSDHVWHVQYSVRHVQTTFDMFSILFYMFRPRLTCSVFCLTCSYSLRHCQTRFDIFRHVWHVQTLFKMFRLFLTSHGRHIQIPFDKFRSCSTCSDPVRHVQTIIDIFIPFRHVQTLFEKLRPFTTCSGPLRHCLTLFDMFRPFSTYVQTCSTWTDRAASACTNLPACSTTSTSGSECSRVSTQIGPASSRPTNSRRVRRPFNALSYTLSLCVSQTCSTRMEAAQLMWANFPSCLTTSTSGREGCCQFSRTRL